jgi:hypothetical protein
MADKNNPKTGSGQEGNQNWDDQNDQRSGGSRQPNPERLDTEETSSGQEGNQEWDDQNDKRNQPHTPNPERLSGGSAFNENQQSAGYGSSQRSENPNVGPLDADLADKTSEKRFGDNKTGPGLG